jgi:hypothetical protein
MEIEEKNLKKCRCGEAIPRGTRCSRCKAEDRKITSRKHRNQRTCRGCGISIPPASKGLCKNCRSKSRFHGDANVIPLGAKLNSMGERICPECRINPIPMGSEIGDKCRLCQSKKLWYRKELEKKRMVGRIV